MNLFNFIKTRVPILDVIGEYATLKKAGLYWKGQCPFHNEKTASFTVSPHKEIFYCFGCHAGGDVITFIAKKENCSPIEAAKLLAERHQLEIPSSLLMEPSESSSEHRKRYYEICKLVAQWCHAQLLKSTTLLTYLQQRKFSRESIDYFSLGYFPGGHAATKDLLQFIGKHRFLPHDLIEANILVEGRTTLYSPFEERLIFPIKDHLGRFCAFGGRVYKPTDERPKYYNSKENSYFAKGSLLFGIDLAKKYIQEKEHAFLVEGYTDCMAMVQNGYKNTVATLGTACTLEHLKQLSRYAQHLYVVYDGDKAGNQAMLRLTELCWQVNLELKVVCLPSKEDPASYLAKNQNLSALVAQAKDIFMFFIDAMGVEFTTKPLSEKISIIRKLLETIFHIDDPLKRDILLQKASKTLEVPMQAMHNELARLEERAQNQASAAHAKEPEKPAENTDQDSEKGLRLEKKVFYAIMSNMQLFTQSNEKYVLEYLPRPLRDILNKLKDIKTENPTIGFPQFFDQLIPEERQYVSRLLLEHEESIEPATFDQLLLQLQKKHWKVIVHDIKTKIAQAKKAGDHEKVEQMLRDFLELKHKMLS